MEWWLTLVIIFGGLAFLMLSGLPVAFCFILINLIGAFLLWGGTTGLFHLILSLSESVTRYSLTPLLLFVLMGEIMFQTGLGSTMVDSLDKWIGRVTGRLSLVTVAAGTLFGAVSGASVATVAMLGSTLIPEMERRGYRKSMTLGPLLGSGGLDIMIPPSSLAVLLGSLAEISVGKLLIATIVPGLIMAVFYALYIILRCKFQPSLAPAYEVPSIPISEKLIDTARYILPMGIIIFLVIGVMFLGIATPTEAAATGALGCFILALSHRRLTWKTTKKSVYATARVGIMLFFIIAGAKGFSQILAFSGASRALVDFAVTLPIAPILLLVSMQIILLILGCFMEVATIMMITVPIFIPIIEALSFDPIWFGAIYLLNMGMATITPPFGLNLFVLKAVSPPNVTLEDVIRAAIPFVCLDLTVMIVMIAFPPLVLWLPNLMF